MFNKFLVYIDLLTRMDAISEVLWPYKSYVAQLGTILSMAQMGSGVFICKDVWKKRTTVGTADVTPFLGGCLLTLLILQNSLLLGDWNLIRSNLIGFSICVAYTSFFYYFTPKGAERLAFWKKIGFAFGFLLLMIVYIRVEDPKYVTERYGLVITTLLLMLIGQPLLKLREIIENKDTGDLPFPMILSGTMVSTTWGTYAIIIKNNFLMIQNMFAVILCLIQLSLFVIYPSRKPSKSDSKKSN